MRYDVWSSVGFPRWVDLVEHHCHHDDCESEHVWVFTDATYLELVAMLRRDLLAEIRDS